MAMLKLQKLYQDMFLGLVLTVAVVYLAVGQLTIVDQRISLPMLLDCQAKVDEQDVLRMLQPALHGDEQCHLQTPCESVHTLVCERSQSATGVIVSIATMDFFPYRVMDAMHESYVTSGYREDTDFRVSLDVLSLLMGYTIMLLFGCALVFALWRQSLLRQTFVLPAGSRTDQMLKPALYGVLVAITLMFVNYLVSLWVEFPDASSRPLMNNMMTSFVGAILAVIIAPVTEELVFRGVWLRYFVERGQALKGALGVSAAFALFHAISWDSLGWKAYAMAIYLILSLVICRIYIKQKNLWSAVVFHAAYNATLLVAFRLY